MIPVLHSFDVWLPLTMTWAYNQICFAEGVEATVVADRTESLDLFPWSRLLVTSPSDRVITATTCRLGRQAPPPSLLAALRHRPPQVIHSHFGYRGWRDLPLAARLGARHVVTFYGHDLQKFPHQWPLWRRRYEELFAAADLFLCEGPHMAATLVEEGAPEGRVGVQPLGVDLERLRYTPRRPCEDGRVKVLIAGAFREKKGIPDALEAVASVREEGLDVVVTIIGDAGSSEKERREKRRILDVIARRGLEGVVRLLGFQPYERLLAEAAAHHLCLSPSRKAEDWDCEGGAPVTLIEFAATGMPIVSTRHCDIPQVVEDGVTGLLADEGDVDGVARRLAELASDPERWEPMGLAARARMERHFDVRALAQALVRRYERLVKSSAADVM